jgi:hypothetical protein
VETLSFGVAGLDDPVRRSEPESNSWNLASSPVLQLAHGNLLLAVRPSLDTPSSAVPIVGSSRGAGWIG